LVPLRSYSFILTDADASKGLSAVLALIQKGQFKTYVDKTFPLEEVVEAHKLSETVRCGRLWQGG